jgi:hypothetical protein
MRPSLLVMRVVVVGAFALACGSSTLQNGTVPDGGIGAGDGATGDDGATPGSDAATDASSTPDADSGDRLTTCIAPPFVAFSTTLTALAATGVTRPLAGAQVGFSSCAGFYLTSDANGQASTQVTKGIAYTPFYSLNGEISVVGAEVPGAVDATTSPLLIDSNANAVIPSYDPNASELTIELDAEGTPPCDSVAGVALTVTSHPEATVSYMGPTWPTDTKVASKTVSVGRRAFITGIAGASKVQLTGTKVGCTVKLVTASQTGNFVLVAGDLTEGIATITN